MSFILHLLNPSFMATHIIGAMALVFCVGCLWACLSNYIKDGIVGKAILLIMCIGAFCVFAKSFAHQNDNISEATLLVGGALYWLRHIWLCYVFRKLQRWYYIKHPHRDRRLNCRGCHGTNLDGTKREPQLTTREG